MDPQTPDTGPNVQSTVDGDGTGNQKAGGGSEAAKAAIELEKMSEILGRKFENADDAVKALKHLQSLVGDRTVADLRKKAETHDVFEKLVAGYAEEEGITPEEARKALTDMAKSSGTTGKDERVDAVLQQMSELKLQLQEKDFLAEHPEAKSVLKELKALAASGGQTLAEAYESSALKTLAAKAAASEEREKMGTSFRPSARSAMPTAKIKEALERLKTDRSGEAKDAAVAAAFGLGR